jgi:V8-like Glu-specific endopeptidase
MGHSVARILVPRFENGAQIRTADGAPWLMVGTAWLVTPQLIMTNHHVICARRSGEPRAAEADLQKQAVESEAEFDFDNPDTRKDVAKIAALVLASKDLDYAILRLDRAMNRPIPRLAQTRLQINATSYLSVNIIQHPRGEPKKVALRNNLVSGANSDTIRYFTDTDYGSSGSPVCDDTWRVVALHRGASYAQGIRYQGKDAAYVNFGSQLPAILDHVREINSSLESEILETQAQ